MRKLSKIIHLTIKKSQKNPQYGSYGKVISSFLNTNGGLLIIGVSERSKKYPEKITWGKISKETLARNLFRNVDPWSSEIIIHPIENSEDENERIFIVDVLKSKTPPHMANGVYYYRNVFESIPMTHSQVKGVFTESHLEKEKITERIIEPLYIQVTRIMEKSDSDLYPLVDKDYTAILDNDRYLYDQVNRQLREKIDAFFKWVDRRNDSNRELRRVFSECQKYVIIGFSKGKITHLDLINKVDLLTLEYKISEGFRVSNRFPDLFECVINKQPPQREPPEKYEGVVESMNAEIKGYNKLTEEEFWEIYKKLDTCTKKSKYYTQWRNSINMIDKLGPELLQLLKKLLDVQIYQM